MIIGIVPGDPTQHHEWHKMEAFLLPAARLGEREVLRPLEAVWVVYDGELIGCATACLKHDNKGEVPLVGGAHFRRWIGVLDEKIGNWMRDEGMTAMRACGRKGWKRILTAQGWQVIGIEGDMLIYERVL